MRDILETKAEQKKTSKTCSEGTMAGPGEGVGKNPVSNEEEKASNQTRAYKRLGYQDRLLIEKMLRNKAKMVRIAERVGVSRNTIYQEVRRGGGKENYSADKGQDVILRKYR